MHRIHIRVEWIQSSLKSIQFNDMNTASKNIKKLHALLQSGCVRFNCYDEKGMSRTFDFFLECQVQCIECRTVFWCKTRVVVTASTGTRPLARSPYRASGTATGRPLPHSTAAQVGHPQKTRTQEPA